MSPGIVFDLDDTLYLEADYVRSGFRAVSRAVALSGAVSVREATEYLELCFERGVRGNTFDRLLEEMPRLTAWFDVQQLVEIYRGHRPEIALLPGVRQLLESLRSRGARLAVVTDGDATSQRRKIAALGLDRLVEQVIVTDEWGRDYWKPNPRAFEQLARRWALPPGRLVYIGDNPAKDFRAGNSLGWRTVRFKIRGQLHADRDAPTQADAPQVSVSSIVELERLLRSWL